MRKILTTVLLCAGLFIYAQTGTVSGNINENSKIALPGAKIILKPGDHYTTSDENGNFVFLGVPVGSYTMEVDYLGYGYKEYKISITQGKDTKQNIIFDNKDRVKNIKEVVLTGVNLQSQARALNAQKNNGNITNVISADQVGKFPDANIGDALKRVTGVTMQNDQGEARNIIIRGLAPELNSVTLNGSRIPSAEGDNRRVQMDLIPSDMIQLIEVNKTLTSDQDADAIGGSVNLVTRSASNKERISFSTASGYNPIREKALFADSFLYSNRAFDKKFGFVINGSYNLNNYGSDNVEAVWSQDKYNNVYVSQMDIRKYFVKRERKSIGFDFDYKFNDKNTIRFSSMYNWRDDWENRYRLRYKKIVPVYGNSSDTSEITGYSGRINRQVKGGIDNAKNDNTRLERQIMQSYSLNGEHLLGSKLKMDWTASYSKAEEQRPNERYLGYEVKGVNFNTDYGTEEQPLIAATSEPALSKYKLSELTEQNQNTYEEEWTGKLNFRVPFSLIEGQKGRLRFGGKARLKYKKRDNDFFSFTPAGSNMNTLNQTPLTYWDGVGYNPSSKYVPGSFPTINYLGGLDFNNASLFSKETVPAEYLGKNYNANEEIYAGYVRWDQDFSENFSMIAGLRLENTQMKYTGNIILNEDILVGSQENKNNYTNLLPSITLKYNFNKNMNLRAAYTTAIARPDYYKLAPYFSEIVSDNFIDAGNTSLKASYANNFDVMYEYYFKSVGLISVGGFYKKINNFIYGYKDLDYTYAEFAAQYPNLTNPIDPTDTATHWTYSQARNGESVNVYGFEVSLQRQLDFLPGFLSHFGLYANYTYTHSKAVGIDGRDGENLMLPGTAPNMFNVSLSWENPKFMARLSLNHTGSYLDAVGGDYFDDSYYDKQTFLDANVSYAIKPWMRLFVDATNLTNQPLRYYQGISSRTMQMEYYKPRFTAGLKFDF